MNLQLKTFISIILCSTISSCTDIKKARLAFQQQNYALANEQWQDLAAHGFPEGFLGLGEMAELSPDTKDGIALEYYQQAYNLGYKPAAYQIGKYYYKHHKNNDELKLAKEWIIKAAQQGNTSAYLLFADMQISGVGEDQNIESALSVYKDLASHGYASASNRLANIYEKGVYTEQNKKSALQHYEQAVSQGHVESALDIGRFYTYGYGVDTDFDKAEAIFQKFSDLGNPKAIYLLGNLYQQRFVVEGKPLHDKSIELIKLSADKGYAPAKHQLINNMLEDNLNNIEYVEKELKSLSKQKDAKASYQLARLMSTKKITATSEEEIKYYQLAYDQGYELSAYRIAEYFFDHQENKKAHKWRQIASQQSNNNALSLQAEFMLLGSHGWPLNQQKAIGIYKSLSDQGMPMASRTLAKMYENNDHINQDYQQALSYYDRAAKQGDINANLSVANFYANGLGVEPDWPYAESIFQHYAQAGYHKAAYLLAKNQEEQALTAGNQIPDQAIQWYQVAASKNNTLAQLKLSEMMLKGIAIPQNINKAIIDLNQLSNKGIAEASYFLGDYYAEPQNLDTDKTLNFYQLAFIQGLQKPVPKLVSFYQNKIGLNDDSIKNFYITSANTGNSASAYLLGVLFEAQSDYKNTIHWYKKSAEANYANAQLALVSNYNKKGNFKQANDWLFKAVQSGNGMAMLQYGEALFWGKKIKTDKVSGLAYVLSASRLHVKSAAAKSLQLMMSLNNVDKIDRANQLSLSIRSNE